MDSVMFNKILDNLSQALSLKPNSVPQSDYFRMTDSEYKVFTYSPLKFFYNSKEGKAWLDRMKDSEFVK